MRKCPFCAEDIQEKAVVCKHCGRDLEVMLPSAERRKCRECQNWITVESRICRHCGKDFGSEPSLEVLPRPRQRKPPKQHTSPRAGEEHANEPAATGDEANQELQNMLEWLHSEYAAARLEGVRLLEGLDPLPSEAREALEHTAVSDTSLFVRDAAILALGGPDFAPVDASSPPSVASPSLTQGLPASQPLTSRSASKGAVNAALHDDYRRSDWWYLRGRIGGLALFGALLLGGIAFSSGDLSYLLYAAGCSIVALFLLGGKGIIWTFVVWAVLLLFYGLSRA